MTDRVIAMFLKQNILRNDFDKASLQHIFAEILKQLQTTSQRVIFLMRRQRQRRDLLKLDDRLMDDIGIRREEATKEGRKHFWQS
jgi:uncharacterized protein YjiS (DUF1127 family)